jgi:hypothetical protein
LVQKPTAATDVKKKESRRQTIHPFYPDLWNDEEDTRLQGRAGSFPRWVMKPAPPDSDDDDSELSPEELRNAIITSTDMLMIDYAEEDALDILFSDPCFEILRQTRHTFLVLFSGGIHGVVFTSEVDTARAHHARSPEHTRETTSMALTTAAQYASHSSSFRDGIAVNAFCSVRDPRNDDPFVTRSIIIGLDSYLDITVAHRDIVYGRRSIEETVYTGAGAATYTEERLVDIVDGLYSFRTIPALVAQTDDHLPSSTHLLLGVPQINDLDIKCDVHRKHRRPHLQSYDESFDFAFDVALQHRLAEKDLQRWVECNPETKVGSVKYSPLDVDVNPALQPHEIAALRQAGADFASVFDAAKGSLPALADHPPVDLNFREGWKHVSVSVPIPKWGPDATTVHTRWANEMLVCGHYARSKSPSASRPHIVRKPPPDAPKDVDIKDCGIRVCGDYRQANDQLQKSFPTTANGTDELSKLPGYLLYWITDRFSMYSAYALNPCPSRELLAVHTPIGFLEPNRMVFGEMNADTVACANTPTTLMLLPNNAHKRTEAYVDDHAQGARNFVDLLQGYHDFLDLFQQKNWSLNATKTKVGYPSCVFFGFEVDIHGTRLADKNLDPVRRMVPPANLPELRSTLGVFVQSSRFIPKYGHIVAPLTALTRSDKGKPVPYIWDDNTQKAYDTIRNLILDGIHLSPPDYRLPFHGGGDASNDGESFGLSQFNDLPTGEAFTVVSHTPSETRVLLTRTNQPHTITHNASSRLHIIWWSKTWSEADRKRAPFYLETDTFLWGLAKSRFYSLS